MFLAWMSAESFVVEGMLAAGEDVPGLAAHVQMLL
jgi:hypothetical protein